jgi:glycosyltransferase involved in cell wall biosynthesis
MAASVPTPARELPVAQRSVRYAPALVHDYLLVMRGAERTFASMAAAWPDAPIHTLLYDEQATRGAFAGRCVVTSRLQRLGHSQQTFRRLLPLCPKAVERLPVAHHDVVISSSSAFAHGVRPAPGAVHVSYCHSPFRYVWHERATALCELPRPLQPALRLLLDEVRRWDVEASGRVTHYLANSAITQQRIHDCYGRESVVVHPPVEVHRFASAEPEDWFLTVSELVRHKRVHIALEAARRAGRRIKVVGTGPDLSSLHREYGADAEFLGRVNDEELEHLYPRARAFVMANVEEFGIAAVEAQAAGRPVLAADAGGARETVVEGETGHRFPVDDIDALAAAMVDPGLDRFDPGHIVANAQRFSVAAFTTRLRREVDRAVAAA